MQNSLAKGNCDSHFTNIDIAIKEINLREDDEDTRKHMHTESTRVDQTLNSFERLVNKNRNLIRVARDRKRNEQSSRVSNVRRSVEQVYPNKLPASPKEVTQPS